MKTKITVLLLIMWSVSMHSQTKPAETKTTATGQVETDVKIYNAALKYGDIDVAKNAVYALIIKHPESFNYLDTLARLYFSNNNYVQCALTSKDYLTHDSANLFIREMYAISLSSLSKNKESLEQYEALFAKTKSSFHAYQIAVLQYVLKRFGECETTVGIILNDPKSMEQKVSINADQNTNQQVPIKAAAYNIRGVMLKEMNKKDEAMESFQEALKLFPDFALAKANIEAIKNGDKPKTTEKK